MAHPTERELRKIVQEWLDAGRLRYNKKRTRIEHPCSPETRQRALAQQLLIQLALGYGLKPTNERDYQGITRGELQIEFQQAELPPLKEGWDNRFKGKKRRG